MTAPDTDVRPLCRPTPPKAGGAGPFTLARLLLRLLLQLRQLDRKLLLLFALSSLPACIVPVGPEFQDPPGIPNSPPQILDPDPTWGDEVTAPGNMGFLFRFTVTDGNAGDDLQIRFFVDGDPVAIQNDSVSGTDTGIPVRSVIENRITCQLLSQQSKLKSRHAVLAAVADRMFDLEAPDPLTVKSPGVATPITWTLNMTCPVSPVSPQ
jgi:hypothetical protein